MTLYARSLFSEADMLPRLAASPAVIERKPTSARDTVLRLRSSRLVCDSNVSQSVAVQRVLNEPRKRLASVRPWVAVAKYSGLLFVVCDPVTDVMSGR